ncbi:MAG: polysaccharide biosynthesis/export family protein [Terrimicrobiaceae bacterium]
MRLFHSLAACVSMLVLGGCVLGPKPSVRFDPRAEALEQAETEEVNRESAPAPDLRQPEGPYLLGAGDEIIIYRLNAKETDPNASLKTFIMPDGKVHYDLAPPVIALGKTVTELSTELTEALRPFYKRPEVSVALRTARSRRYWILGKVSSPNIYPLNQPTTLLDAIARAGGLELMGGTGTTEELADLSRSFLVRDKKILPLNFEALIRQGDARYNVYIRNQDFIFLPPKSTKEIMVLGAVGVSKSVGWREGMGLVGALAEAQGPKSGAYVQRVLLVRGSFTKPRVAILNYDSIVKGKHRDVAVLPGDIIWVPISPWQRIERYIDVILNTAVETMAANEGIRIVQGEDAGSVGVQLQLDSGSNQDNNQQAPAPTQ